MSAKKTEKNNGLGYGGWSIICAVISLAIFPPIFGLIGLIFGIIGATKNEGTKAVVGIILSIVFSLIGIILGIIMFSTMLGFVM